MSQENNNDLQAFEDTSHYTRNHYQSTSLNQLTNSISSAVSQLEAENRDLKIQVRKLREENGNLRSEAPIDKQALHERLQTIKSMCEFCESILGIKPSIGYHPQGQAQNHLQMRPQNGESLMSTFNFGAHSMLTTKPPTPERMVEETNRPSSPSHSHDNTTSVNIVDNFSSAFTVWVAWRGRPSSDAQLRQIFSGLDIKDVRPSPNKSFAHIDFSTAESMNKALERNNEDIPNLGHLRVEKGNPHPRPTMDNRPRQQNQQNRKNDYNRGAYSNAFTSRQNSSNINFDDGMDENQKASSIKSWQDMAAQSQGTTSIPNHQEHKGNNGDM